MVEGEQFAQGGIEEQHHENGGDDVDEPDIPGILFHPANVDSGARPVKWQMVVSGGRIAYSALIYSHSGGKKRCSGNIF